MSLSNTSQEKLFDTRSADPIEKPVGQRKSVLKNNDNRDLPISKIVSDGLPDGIST